MQINFVCLLCFGVTSNSAEGLLLGSVLWSYSWQATRTIMECRGSNLGWPGARQTPYCAIAQAHRCFVCSAQVPWKILFLFSGIRTMGLRGLYLVCTWVNYVQNKCPTCCTVSPAPQIDFIQVQWMTLKEHIWLKLLFIVLGKEPSQVLWRGSLRIVSFWFYDG